MRTKILSIVLSLIDNLSRNKSTKQRVFKNTFWLTFAEIVSKIILFFITVQITRYLGVDNYGKYSFAFAFVALFGTFSDFGFNQITTRDVAQNFGKAKQYIGNVLSMKIILGLINFLLIAIVIHFLHKSADVVILVYLAALNLIIQGFVGFLQSIFQAFEKMQYTFISRVTNYFSLFIFISVSILFRTSMATIIVCYVITALISLTIAMLLTWRFFTAFRIEIDISFWKKIFIQSWPFFLSFIFFTIYTYSDSVLLSIYRNYREIGLYQAAYKIFFAFQLINIVHQAVFPTLSTLYGNGDFYKYKSVLRKMFFLSTAVLIPMGIFMTLFSKTIMYLIYGVDFMNAGFALSMLLWTEIVIFFSYFWASSLTITNSQKKFMYATLIGAAVNLGLNFLIIPKYGFNGAAVTTFLSEFIIMICNYSQTDIKIRNFFIS